MGSTKNVIWGLEEAIYSMKVGERCLLSIIPPYTYVDESEASMRQEEKEKAKEDAEKPFEDENIRYIVELISMQQAPDPAQVSAKERLEIIKRRKEEGNQLYKDKRLKRALYKYKASLQYFSQDEDEDSELTPQLKSQLYLNIAAIYFEQGDYREVIRQCDKSILFDSRYGKAYVRRAKAFAKLQDFDAANEDFQNALTVDPNNEVTKKEIEAFRKVESKQLRKESAMYRKMMLPQEEEEERDKQEKEAPQEQSTTEESGIAAIFNVNKEERAKMGFVGRVLSDLFIPGISEEYLKLLYGSFLGLAGFAVFVVIVTPQEQQIHAWVFLALVAGLIISTFAFINFKKSEVESQEKKSQ
eukprot:TRINITY_DN1293_c0_g1_i2.p1 TRINITY_DN1293_c0_g1~~TRINITY_DN1293_c0_g1_i2.p1  ORF type:complete len:357 (+),score=98.10 TRINITY_DN1293_c0_g1_i2:394-1464(+)